MKTFSRYLKEAYLINLIHDKNDKLHKILDSLDGATVSRLMAGDEVTLNPRNPRAASSIKVVKKILK